MTRISGYIDVNYSPIDKNLETIEAYLYILSSCPSGTKNLGLIFFPIVVYEYGY